MEATGIVCSGQYASGTIAPLRRRSLFNVSSNWEGWDGTTFTESPSNSSCSNINSMQGAVQADGGAGSSHTSSHTGVLFQAGPAPQQQQQSPLAATPPSQRPPAFWVPVRLPAAPAALRA